MEQNTRGYKKINLLKKALDFYYENYNDRNFIGKNSYKEYFNSRNLVKNYSEHVFTYRRIQYGEDIKANFSEEEWKWIFYHYFLDSDKHNNHLLKNIGTIPQSLRYWVDKISEPESVWRGEQNGFLDRQRICEKLSKVAEENKKFINFPIKIKGKKIYFGAKKVE